MSNESHSPETLAKAATSVEDAYTDIEKNIQKKLYTEVESLMGTWKGDGARAFYQGFQAFDKEFADVQNSLNTLHQNLVQSKIDYSVNENEQSQTAMQLKNIIGG